MEQGRDPTPPHMQPGIPGPSRATTLPTLRYQREGDPEIVGAQNAPL